jgi:uncharacterized membrane protein
MSDERDSMPPGDDTSAGPGARFRLFSHPANLLLLLQILLLSIALGIAGYLSFLKLTQSIPPCTADGGCALALYSPWGYLLGIPIAYIGAVFALALIVLAVLRRDGSDMLVLIIGAAGMAFTVYLRYVEQRHFGGRICPWCVGFMVFLWLGMGVAIWRYLRPA